MKTLIIMVFVLFILSGVIPSFAQETNPGFTNAVILSNISSDSASPNMITTSDGVFALWTEYKDGKSNVFFSKSTDGGNTFAVPINLSESNVGQSDYAAFAVKDKDVYVVWQTSISGTASVFLTKSTDGGTSFARPVMISDKSKLAAFPQIAISDAHVYSAWLEKSDNNSTNIVFEKSDDNANSFGTPLSITQNLGNSGIPKLLATGNQVYLAWEDNSKGNFEIFLSKSDDSGVSFHPPVVVSGTSGQSGTPQIAVSGNNVYATWMDNTSKNYDILFSKSTDGGNTFSTPVNVSKLHADSGYQQFTVSGNNIYVVWTQTISDLNYDVFFAKSSDNGDTFDTPVNLSNNNGGSGWPKIAYDGNIYVSWVDSTPGRFDVFVTKSSDGGKTFDHYTDVSHTKNESYDNKMSVLNNAVYLMWQEGNKGNHTIVFSKSTTFVPEFGPFASIALIVSIAALVAVSFRSGLKLN